MSYRIAEVKNVAQVALEAGGRFHEGGLAGGVLLAGLLLERGGLDDGVLGGLADAGELGNGGAHDFFHRLGGLGCGGADGFGEAAGGVLLHARDGLLQ